MKQLIESGRFSLEEIRERVARIHRLALARSPYLKTGNFTRIHSSDLQLLFDLYDQSFFDGEMRAALGNSPLRFRISRRMTSAGGHTVRFTPRGGHGTTKYEIAVASTLLFQAFADDSHRTISSCGHVCHDRLEALQRIMEHELVHLIENLVWSSSSCSAPRFRSIARRFFGHTESTHQLITPKERAFVQFQVHRGAKVRFRVDGREYQGIVNRVTKRATVLVRDEEGQLYSDGHRYAKYYVPFNLLRVIREK
jgi:hypothetical protein